MPTLNRRADGGYFVLKHYHDHQTWQISAEGVRALERRGVREGASFDTALFMQLYMQGWLWTGNSTARSPQNLSLAAQSTPPELKSRIQGLHLALVSQDADGVVEHVSTVVGGDEAKRSARTQVEAGFRIESWRHKDTVLHSLDSAMSEQLPSTQLLAVVSMVLKVETKMPVQEIWFLTGGLWSVAWGFPTLGGAGY